MTNRPRISTARELHQGSPFTGGITSDATGGPLRRLRRITKSPALYCSRAVLQGQDQERLVVKRYSSRTFRGSRNQRIEMMRPARLAVNLAEFRKHGKSLRLLEDLHFYR